MIQVSFTYLAHDSLKEIYNYLKNKWTQKEINHLKNDIKDFIQTLDDAIIVHVYFENTKIQSALLGKKQITVYFKKVSDEEFDVLLFWPNKGNPENLKNLLK